MNALLTPDEIRPVKENLDRTLAALDAMLLGRPELHRLVLAGILARGHILLEGLPGLGKTALVSPTFHVQNENPRLRTGFRFLH